MSETISHLFQVAVTGPGGSTWKVLVRAVDAESAAGSVRARGHNVVGVKAAAMPKRRHAAPRVACLKCGYALTNLPVGEGGEIMCPECGVINTPELPTNATVLDEIRARQGNRSRVALLLLMLAVLLALVVLAMGGISVAKLRALLP